MNSGNNNNPTPTLSLLHQEEATKEKFISNNTVLELYDVSSATLRRWADAGKVKCIRSPGGKRLYSDVDLKRLFNLPVVSIASAASPSTTTTTISTQPAAKKKVCYARVSSQKQEADLDRQVADLQRDHPNHEIIRDIGSAINFHRHGFTSLVERVLNHDIGEVVIAHRDRLCRIAFELIEMVFRQCGCKIVVLGHGAVTEQDTTQELSEDLLAITTIFVVRNNGLRAQQNRRNRKAAEGKEGSGNEREKRKGNEENRGEKSRKRKGKQVGTSSSSKKKREESEEATSSESEEGSDSNLSD